MKDPLIAWIEEDPMNARMFLDYDAQTSLWAKIVYRVRLFLAG
jgi:hypothetical protein